LGQEPKNKMPNDEFSTGLVKLLCAETWFLCQMTASREMYGKSYFALGVAEKQAVDQTVLNTVGAIQSSITPEWLGVSSPKTKGFHSPEVPDAS
jgi:hypothetical protein